MNESSRNPFVALNGGALGESKDSIGPLSRYKDGSSM